MKAEEIRTVVVIGAGIMGEGIAQNFAEGGMAVRLVDRDGQGQVLSMRLNQIRQNLNLFEEHGMLRENPSEIMKRIQPIAGNLKQAVDGCDFIVETIPEILQAKKDLLAQLDALPEHVIIASNTGSITISRLTEGMRTQQRVVGTHYFNPAHIIPLVEIHRGKETSELVIQTTIDFMKRMEKAPVFVRKEIPGFVVNRIQSAMAREAHYLVSEGVVSPEDLDIATKASYGMRLACLGPMETADLSGLDTIYRACAAIFPHLNNDPKPSHLLEELVNKGDLGVKSGKGWFDYTHKSSTELLKQRDGNLLRQFALYKKFGTSN